MGRFTQLLSWAKTKKSRSARVRHATRDRRSRFLGLESLEERALMASLVGHVLSGSIDTTIGGTVYEDLNKDGMKNAGENGIKGWTVYLDLDNSGTLNTDAAGTPEPSAVTDVDGNYLIRYLLPGNYRVSEVVPSGWSATAPAFLDVAVLDGKDTKADFFNFHSGVSTTGDIVGTVWNDLNANGLRDAADPGLANWTVFLDLNNNRVLDAGELSTLTDANGNYTFTGLAAGDHEVTEVLPAGWGVSRTFDTRQTVRVTAGAQSTARDFANVDNTNGSIQGTVWNDLNADGLRNSDRLRARSLILAWPTGRSIWT